MSDRTNRHTNSTTPSTGRGAASLGSVPDPESVTAARISVRGEWRNVLVVRPSDATELARLQGITASAIDEQGLAEATHSMSELAQRISAAYESYLSSISKDDAEWIQQLCDLTLPNLPAGGA